MNRIIATIFFALSLSAMGLLSGCDKITSSDTPTCVEGAPSVEGGTQKCGIAWYFGSDSCSVSDQRCRLIAQMFANKTATGDFHLTDSFEVPKAGTYAGYWTCSGKSLIPPSAPIQTLVRESNVPCGNQNAQACAIPAKNEIEVRRGVTPPTRAGLILHERYHNAGCDHEGSHDDASRNLYVIIDLQGTTLNDPVRK